MDAHLGDLVLLGLKSVNGGFLFDQNPGEQVAGAIVTHFVDLHNAIQFATHQDSVAIK